MGNLTQSQSPLKDTLRYDIDGTRWFFTARIYDVSSTKLDNGEGFSLPNKNIELFEYTNELNKFCLYGQIIYRDTDRKMGQYYRLNHLLMQVEWSEQELEKVEHKADWLGEDEGAGQEMIEKPLKPEDYFRTIFIVNKMQIIRHDMPDDILVYKIELMHVNWFPLSAVCQYSNYADADPKEITNIIRDILVQTVGLDQVDTESFEKCKQPIKIYFTTHMGDNAITAINYLLNRLYTEPASFGSIENHIRVIAWDERLNKYRMLKISDDTTYIPGKDKVIDLSRYYKVEKGTTADIAPFETSGMHGMQTAISTSAKVPYTKYIDDFYTRSYWSLNIVKDKLVRKYIKSDDIVNRFRDPNINDEYRKDPATPNILHESNEKLQKWLKPNAYFIDESQWRNTRHMYSDQLYRMFNSCNLELERQNRISHQPGQLWSMQRNESHRQKEFAKIDDLTAPVEREADAEPVVQQKDLKDDNQLFGYWFMWKIRHAAIFKDSGKSGAEPQFQEKVCFCKYNQIVE